MCRFFLHIMFSLFIVAQLISPAAAGQAATASEAQALVVKAVAFLKMNGKEKAIEEFNKAKSAFVNHDLYIFVLDRDGLTLANGVNQRIVGKNVMEMKDNNGKAFIKDILKIGNEKGSGWVDYVWPDPATKKLSPKSTYVEKAGDIYICAGIYK